MRFVATIAALALSATAALADPVGSYSVDGRNPDGSSYKGSVSVSRTGETFKVVWAIGSEKYVGTAVGDDDFFAVGYRSGNQSGIAVYSRDGKGWKGIWTYQGGTSIGLETLTPK